MTSTPITAIPTRYAGCHFRSRLEARWAVFFDHLGIEWLYEPQGYLIHGQPYLPDFKLIGVHEGVGGRQCDAWVEVRGDEARIDRHQLAIVALNMGPFLVLGNIPRPALKGDWGWVAPGQWAAGNGYRCGFGQWGNRNRLWFLDNAQGEAPWTEPLLDDLEDGGLAAAAYVAARSARFEHGETPR